MSSIEPESIVPLMRSLSRIQIDTEDKQSCNS